MEQRDYFMRQIEQLGRALGKALADLAGYRKTGNVAEGIEQGVQFLKTEVDIDIDEVLSFSSEELTAFLKSRLHSTLIMDQLAALLYEMGIDREEINGDLVHDFYKTALAIYRFIDESESSYSIERQEKIKELESKLL